jgi:predicted HicB family RNase H-like nuclease
MILKLEGFIADVDYQDGDGLMHGTSTNTRATLHFAGKDVDELKRALAETIEDYRWWRKERGIEAEKGYSGTLSLRIDPDLHKRVAEPANAAGESINQFIAEKLQEVTT